MPNEVVDLRLSCSPSLMCKLDIKKAFDQVIGSLFLLIGEDGFLSQMEVLDQILYLYG